MKNIHHKLIKFILFTGLFFPFLLLIIWSLSAGWASDSLWPNAWGLRGWMYLFSPTSRMLSSLAISICISGMVTGIALILCIPAGKALGLYHFRGKSLVEIIVMVPIIIPAITVGMGIHIVFIRWGLADTFWGVVLVQLPIVLPYGIRIFASIYKALGTKWEEQAKVLKANKWQVFRYSTLPFLTPGVATASVLMFNVSFSQYFLTYLIGGGKVMTLPLLLFPFVNGGDRVIASGLSLVLTMTSLILMLLVEKIITNKEHIQDVYYL